MKKTKRVPRKPKKKPVVQHPLLSPEYLFENFVRVTLTDVQKALKALEYSVDDLGMRITRLECHTKAETPNLLFVKLGQAIGRVEEVERVSLRILEIMRPPKV